MEHIIRIGEKKTLSMGLTKQPTGKRPVCGRYTLQCQEFWVHRGIRRKEQVGRTGEG